MDEAQQLCDDVLIMDHGQVIARGTPRQLLNQHFDEVFIYLPAEQVPNELCQQNNWQVHEQQVEITTTDVEATITLLLSEKISLTGLHVKSPNLDDLFLKLTGHSLRD